MDAPAWCKQVPWAQTGAEPATEKSAGAPKKQGPDSRWVRSQLPCPALIYICWSWLPVEHGKIEENTVNSGIFNGWGDKGIGSIVEHDVFDRFYGDKSVKYRALKETIAKTWKHIQRTRDLGDYLGVVV